MTVSRNILVRALFAFFAIVAVSGIALSAQDQAPAPQQQQAQQPQQQEQAEPQSQKPQVEQAPPGIARQLVHQTREAAGEEKDETAEFKQSSSVRLISRLTGLDLRSAYWLCVLTNFIVIAAVIIWATRKYAPAMFRARTGAIQKAMQEAQRASAEARTRLADIESRLSKLDTEIAAIRDSAEKEAAVEEARIQTATKEEAQKIVASAEQEIAAAAKAARRQLTAYAADLAVGLAQKQIRVDAATDQVLVRNFTSQMSASSDNSGSASQRKDGN